MIVLDLSYIMCHVFTIPFKIFLHRLSESVSIKLLFLFLLRTSLSTLAKVSMHITKSAQYIFNILKAAHGEPK